MSSKGEKMSGVILFKSKYGATKKYAHWLSEATGFSCMDIKDVRLKDILSYDTIILGGGIHASGIQGLSFLAKNMQSLKNKKILVFCVGASPYDEKAFHEILDRNMKGDLRGIPLFYCRGAWNLATMTFVDQKMCKLLRSVVAKKPPEEREPWMNALLEAGDSAADWTDKAYLSPILEQLKKSEAED